MMGKHDLGVVHDMGESITAVFNHCCDIGMQLPFVVACMDHRGSIIAMRVHGGGRDGDVLVQRMEGGGIALPFTVFVLDQNNAAAKAVIEAEAIRWN
jgi:hypothetical protein